MKTTLTAFLLLILAYSTFSSADELENEIKSGSYCKSVIYDKFKLIEKSKHERVKFNPSGRLLEFALSMELMCPWGTERDFNGDNKADWIGFVKIDNKYQLLAYLSMVRQYQVTTIASYDKAPSEQFIRWIQTAHLSRFTDKKLNLNSSMYALQVAQVDGLTDIYLWNGKQMEKVLSTPQLF